jgi:hypothetical protein
MKLLILSDMHGTGRLFNRSSTLRIISTRFYASAIWSTTDRNRQRVSPGAIRERRNSLFIGGIHDLDVALKMDPRSSPPFRHLRACTQAFSTDAAEMAIR